MSKVAIVGSRYFNDYQYFKGYVLKWEHANEKIETVISGGCRGTDKLAEKFATENSRKLKIFRPDWNKYGRRAGPLRNTQIIDAADYLIAFPMKNSRGTYDSIRKAHAKNIPVTIHLV